MRESVRSILLTAVVALVLTPVTIFAAFSIGNRSYYLASVLIIMYAIVPFFVSFEQARPTAKELSLLAMMCVITMASRIIFIWLPFFKPMGAFVVIAGIAFGPRSGFMVGAFSMFASNFIFGQGPWTPWQMFAFGLLGFLAGLLARVGVIPRKNLGTGARIAVSIGIGIVIVALIGPILDTCSLFLFSTDITPETVVAIYGAGLLPNAIQAAGSSVTFLLIGNASLDKLSRVSTKFGIDAG